MKKATIVQISMILLIITASITGCITEEKPVMPEEQTETDIALILMDHFINNTIPTAYNTLFTDEIKEQTTVAQLEMIWNQITSAYGDFIEITSTKTTEEQGYTIVYVTCTYADLGLLDTRVVFDENKSIAGFQFVPTDISDQYQPPNYANTNLFTETNVTIGEGTEWELPGTLSIPTGDGPYPVVILVHGSGPNDRDETIGPNKPFKDLAWGLASKGIAVLRYEKRTKQYSSTIVNQLATFTVYQETINDALETINLFSTYDNIDGNSVYILGHSLGGMLAPRIAEQTTALAGIILMAAPTRHLEELLMNQTIYLSGLDGEITAEEQVQIDAVQDQVEQIQTLSISEDEIILGAGRAYWEDLSTYYPAQTAESLNIPMLILQGKRDYQVTYEGDFIQWNASFTDNDNVSLITYESLNHLFIAGEGDPTNTEYTVPANVDEQVINDIANWITALSGEI